MEIVTRPGSLAVAAVLGLVCALIAGGRGRNAFGWFIVGFCLPCLGLVLVLVLPDLSEERARHDRLHTENRRLREQVRKERQVAERRHAATQRRIDVHDRELQVDTAGLVEEADAAELGAPPPRPPTSEERESFERSLWFYLTDQDEQIGPVPFAELRGVWREGRIGTATHVWREGMTDWLPLGELPGLEGEFRA